MLSIWQTIGLITIITTIYLFSLAIYRLTLHPLAKFPGRFLSKISDWPLTWQCTTGDRHLTLLEEHRQYGPIVRIGPNTLSFSSPKALRQVYQSLKGNATVGKSEYYNTLNIPSGAHSLHSETSPSKHAVRHRVLEHAFTPAALRSNEPFIVDAVDILCRALSPTDTEEWSEPKNMRDYAAWFAYDVMGSLVFGRRFDCLTNEEHRHVPKLVITGMIFLYAASQAPIKWLVEFIMASPTLMNTIAGSRARDELALAQYSHSCMVDRLAQEEKSDNSESKGTQQRRDMTHYIIEALKNPESKGYGRQELDADSAMLIGAGSDTTSVTLSALLFYLTLPTSANILIRLNNEIRNSMQFPTLESLTGSTTMILPYLRACIDEALRLAPPVVTHLPRTVLKKEGVEIDGELIPAGTVVGATAYVLHHDEQAYINPWKFDPERWLIDENIPYRTSYQVRKAKEAFIPFSIGSRGCIGKDLAYRELCLCVARLLYQFDIRRAMDEDGCPDGLGGTKGTRAGLPIRDDEYQLFDYFMVDRDGPNIQFRRRK